MPPSVDKRVPFQQVTIEYRVVGDFDGLTLGPNVIIDPTSDDYNEPDERGIHVVDVPGNLGLIDPDLIGAAAQGDRCIPWVYLDTQGVGGAVDSLISVLDNVERNQGVPVPSQQRAKFYTGGVPLFFAERPTSIPQGSVLGLIGYGGGSVKIFRLNIVAPQGALEFAAMLEACCCADVPCDNPPVVTGADQVVIFTPSTDQIVFAGQNLDPDGNGIEGTMIQVADSLGDPETGGSVSGTYVTGDDTGATVEFVPGAAVPPGSYQIYVADPEDPSCNNALQDDDAPTILFWPADCPFIDDPQAGTPFAAPVDSPTLFSVTGQNLGTPGTPAVASIRFVSQTSGNDLSSASFVTVDSTTLDITVDPSNPPDDFGLYDLIVTPVNPSCPEQKIVGVLQVNLA